MVVSHLRPKGVIRTLLDNALSHVQRSVNDGNRGPIPNAGWRYLGREATYMAVYSEAQHETTYEILLTAIRELQRWMRTEGRTWGTCSFTIWNGRDKVGEGGIYAAGGF